MNENVNRAATRMGPYGGATAAAAANQQGRGIAVIGSVSTTTTTKDLTLSAYFGTDRYLDGEYVTIQADAAIWYCWSNDASNTLDPTQTDATNQSQQCIYLAANTDKDEIPAAQYFSVRTVSGTGTVRIYRSVRVKGR